MTLDKSNFCLVKMRYAPVSEWVPNLRNRGKGNKVSLSNPFPTVPETAGRKAARCAYEKPMIKSTYKKRVKSKGISLFLFYGLQIQFQVIFLNEVLFAHGVCENEGQDCGQDEANQNQTKPIHRGNLLNKPILILIGCISLFFAALIYLFTQISRDEMGVYSTLIANILLFSIILLFILWGLWKKINVYDAFIEGAKEGFTTAIRIIPYLVAFLVGIAVFRTSGAMDILVNGIGYVVGLFGVDTSFVGALPTALMKSLSGSGANGLMIDTMKQYGADSFVGRMSCVARGASDTTFYILAVYFGSVGITKTRNAVTCGLIADFSGIIAAIIISYLFFF